MPKETVVRNNLWKWLTLLVVAVGSAYLTIPVKEKIRFGLDLEGGSSFTLGVDDVRLRDKLTERLIAQNPGAVIDEATIDSAVAETLKGNDDRIVQIVRRRVDAMGTNEPLIQPIKDKHRIIVQLPGVDSKTRDAARDRLEKMSYLEFRLVPKNERELIDRLPPDQAPAGFVKVDGGYRRAVDWAKVSQGTNYLSNIAAFGRRTVRSFDTRFILQPDEHDKGLYRPRFVTRTAQLTGDQLASASYSSPEGMQTGFTVNFTLTDKGAAIFRKLTHDNIGRQLAIVLDDELISSPVIKSEIGGTGQITGDFTLEEAKRLSSDLNAGALPAPLKILAESSVDPTVGADAIERGKWAALIGFALVAVFMLFYYWRLGGIADIALLLDVILLPAALFLVANLLSVFAQDPSMDGSKFQLPVLTMPGIAGLVLTLGMAVDANVLIFERIREEFARGASVGKAVENGYGRAFTAILDSNLTTIITGAILYSVGTGPVRGFAIMLTGGVVISMFTALVVTRLIVDHTSDPDSSKPFKMRQFFAKPNFDFMKYGRKTLLGSAIVIVLTIGLFTYRLMTNPGQVLAVDLTGGTSVIYVVTGEKPDVNAVRKVLEPIDNAMLIQYQSALPDENGEKDSGVRLQLKTGVMSDSGTTLKYSLAKNAKEFNLETVKKALAEFDKNSTVFVDSIEEKVENGVTNSVASLTIKVSETSASVKGGDLAKVGSSVEAEITKILKRGKDKFGAELVTVNEVVGVEDKIDNALAKAFPKASFTAESRETVGSVVGADLRESGTKAVLFSLVAILIYVAFRFRFAFGVGGIVALAHDALIALGIYSLLGHQVSLIVITALLTIIGYSINDTVVVFDRIRELLKYDKRMSFNDLCNAAINSCLSRTVITSVTTFFAVAALFIFGEGSIYDFALTMLIGVVAGTYSSIFIATPIMAWICKYKRPDLDEDKEEKAK